MYRLHFVACRRPDSVNETDGRLYMPIADHTACSSTIG